MSDIIIIIIIIITWRACVLAVGEIRESSVPANGTPEEEAPAIALPSLVIISAVTSL